MATITITKCDICGETIEDGTFVGKTQIYGKDHTKDFGEVCPYCIDKFLMLIGNLLPMQNDIENTE